MHNARSLGSALPLERKASAPGEPGFPIPLESPVRQARQTPKVFMGSIRVDGVGFGAVASPTIRATAENERGAVNGLADPNGTLVALGYPDFDPRNVPTRPMTMVTMPSTTAIVYNI
jgi:hypothetical protein